MQSTSEVRRDASPATEPAILDSPPDGWIPVKAAAETLGVSSQTIRNRIAAGRYRGGLCRTAGPVVCYVDPACDADLAAIFCDSGRRGGPAVCETIPADEARRVARLSAKQRREAARRQEAVAAWGAVRDGLPAGTPVQPSFKGWSAEYSPAHGYAKPISWATMWRWQKASAGGLATLAPDRAGPEPAEPSRQAWAFFQTLYLDQNKRTVRDCWRQTKAAARKHGWDWIGYAGCRAKVEREIPQATRVLYRDGRKALNDKCLPYIERDYETIAPNDWWVADHHQCDVAVINPATGRPAFPWYTNWLDCKSRKPVGRLMHFCPNMDVVLASLREAFLEHGLAVHLLFDNGKEYRSRQVTGGRPNKRITVEVDEHRCRAALSHLPIEIHFAEPYNAQAKPNERYFRTVESQFGKQWRSYRGSNPGERSEDVDRVIRDYAGNGLVPPLQVFAEALYQWEDEVYCKTVHTGQGMNGRTPDQVYRQERRRVVRVDEDELVLLMMRSTDALTVGRNGVKLFGRHYNAPELFGWQGKKVFVRYDPERIGVVYIFDAGDRLICTAHRKDLLAWGAKGEDVRQAKRLKHQQRRAAQSYRETSDQLAGDPLQNLALQRQAAEAAAHDGPGGDGGGGEAARPMTIVQFRSILADTAEQLRHAKRAVGMNDLPEVSDAACPPAGRAGGARHAAAPASDVFDGLDV